MFKRILIILISGLCLAVAAPAQKKVDPKTLALKYQDWLKLTTYHIGDKELDVFMSLQNDRDRDIFIDMFWNKRDPTPATPANEFKDELLKRFAEANKRFRAARAGWMTDRGRFWIMLGQPINVTRIEGGSELYPVEIWSYYGDVSKRMPTHFSLVFFQRGNSGEYKLYDPVSDGPTRLMVNGRNYDPDDYEAMYRAIYEWQPDLAFVSLSIIPGEIPYGYRPSPENMILMAAITEAPKKMVDESYATHFLKYKGVVDTEYLTNSFKSNHYAMILRDPITGQSFCHFGISPEKLSLDYYEPKDEYSANFQTDVSLRIGDKVILQYAKEYPLTIPASRLADTENMGIAIEDSFPIAEGTFQLTVLLRNIVGKEFSVIERELVVPPPAGRPTLGGILIGYKLATSRIDAHAPFLIADQKISIEPKSSFAAGDQISFLFQATGVAEPLWKTGTVKIAVKGNKPTSPSVKSFSIRLDSQPFRDILTFGPTFAASELFPDYYEVTITLTDEAGKALAEKSSGFVLSNAPAMSHPMSVAKSTPAAGRFLFQYMLAQQYAQLGLNEKAETAYKTGFGQNPSYLQKVPEYAGFLLRIGKVDEALQLVETIKSDDKLRFQYFSTKGLALKAKGRIAEAADALVEGNRVYNSDIPLLNALGECYQKLGRKEDAIAVLESSLKLKPEQPEIRKLLESIRGR
jgi:GWxTD domain-containing protein